MVTTLVKREDWTAYVARITAGVPRKEVAKAAGISESGVHRWLAGKGEVSAKKAVDFARGLGESPIEALIAAGFLEPGEAAGVHEVHAPLSDRSDDEMVSEFARRLHSRPPLPNGDDIADDITRRLLAGPSDGGEGVEDEL